MSESIYWRSRRDALPRKEKRWKFISRRISQGEYQEIVNEAKASGMSKTKWVNKPAGRESSGLFHYLRIGQRPGSRRIGRMFGGAWFFRLNGSHVFAGYSGLFEQYDFVFTVFPFGKL